MPYRSALLFAPLVLPMAIPASAQASQSEIVVKAPKNLNSQQAKEWGQLNREAGKIAERLEKLRTEARDDVEDVREAEKALASAEDKLEDEQKDQEKTARRLAKAQRDLTKIADRRRELRRGM